MREGYALEVLTDPYRLRDDDRVSAYERILYLCQLAHPLRAETGATYALPQQGCSPLCTALPILHPLCRRSSCYLPIPPRFPLVL